MLSSSRLVALSTTLASLALSIATAPARGQTARLEGIVIDSLRGVPLAGARVQVGEDPRRFVTDSTGRFWAESLPAGRHEVRLMHAVLDSLGVGSVAAAVQLRPDTAVRITLGTPSGETFLARLCTQADTAARRPEGRSALFGVVRAVDSDGPIAGAAVRLFWRSMVVDPTLGVRRKTDVRNVVTDATGLYVICNTPPGLDAAFTVVAAGYDTAAAEIYLGHNTATLQHVMMTPRGAEEGAAEESGTLVGTVRDEQGKPLEGAEVVMVTRTGVVLHGPARTGADGRFALRDARAGTQLVEVRRLGSTPVRRTVTLGAGREARLDVTLEARAVQLAEVDVAGKPAADKHGFSFRRGMGGGQFFTRDDLTRRNVMMASDLVQQLPSLRLDGGTILNQNPRQNPTRAACPMATLVDGVITPSDLVLKIPRDQIDGVEVYEVATKVPTEYSRPETRCGAMLIWTKQAR